MVQKLSKMVLYGPYSYKTPSFSYDPCFSYHDKSQGTFLFFLRMVHIIYIHSKKKVYNSQPKHYLSYTIFTTKIRCIYMHGILISKGPSGSLVFLSVFNCAPLINNAQISFFQTDQTCTVSFCRVKFWEMAGNRLSSI